IESLLGASRFHVLRAVEAAHFPYGFDIAELFESVDGRLYHVVRVVAANRFGEHVRNTAGLHHRAHRTTGDDARTFARRLQHHETGAEAAEYLMRNGAFEQMDAAQILLRRFNALADGGGNFLRLTHAEADHARLRVAHHDESREAHVLTALDDLRHAVNRDDIFLEIE